MTLKLFLVNEPLSSRCPHSAGLEDFDPYPFVTNNLINIVFTSTINMNTLQVQLQVGGKNVNLSLNLSSYRKLCMVLMLSSLRES